MTPGELQAFNQAVALINQGMRKAAHPILVNLAQNNPTEPNLLFWLVYSSSEASQAQQYLNRLVALDPYNPSIAAAHDWIANPANFSQPNLAIYSQPRPFERAEYGYPPIVKSSATNSTSNNATLTPTLLLDKIEKKNIFGGEITWQIEMNNQKITVGFKHNDITQKKEIRLNGRLLNLKLSRGILMGGQHEDNFFKIGPIEAAVRVKEYNFKPCDYSLIVNGRILETAEQAVFANPERRSSIPWEALVAGIFCLVGSYQIFKGIVPAMCGGLAFGFCSWLGRDMTISRGVRNLLLFLTCIVFFAAMFFVFKVPPYR